MFRTKVTMSSKPVWFTAVTSLAESALVPVLQDLLGGGGAASSRSHPDIFGCLADVVPALPLPLIQVLTDANVLHFRSLS